MGAGLGLFGFCSWPVQVVWPLATGRSLRGQPLKKHAQESGPSRGLYLPVSCMLFCRRQLGAGNPGCHDHPFTERRDGAHSRKGAKGTGVGDRGSKWLEGVGLAHLSLGLSRLLPSSLIQLEPFPFLVLLHGTPPWAGRISFLNGVMRTYLRILKNTLYFKLQRWYGLLMYPLPRAPQR